MSVLEDTLKKHRQRIIRREEQAFRELLTAYSVVEKELKASVRVLQKKIAAAQTAGEEISPSWFQKDRRLRILLDQVKSQIERFGGTAARITSNEQRYAITIAAEQAGESFRVTVGDKIARDIGTTLNTRAVENAVGMMGDGTPILEYYRENLAPKVAEMIRVEVIKAAALGTDFRKVATRLQQTGQITRSRALSTARTEVNRVRRETTRQIYQDNSDVISGWEWVAAKSPRTCAVCLAMDGRIFKLDQPFPQHVNCRCTMIAVIIGVPRPKRTLGKDWFDQQPDDVKIKIIGVDGLAAYKNGLVKLDDFVGWKNDKQFGRSVYTRPLSQILSEKPIAEKIIRTPKNITVDFDGDIEDSLTDMLGVSLSPDEIGGLVGAFDGATIEITDFGDGINFTIFHPLIAEQRRVLDTDWAGRPFIHNSIFRTSRTAPKGSGLKSFATQVMHAQRFGVEYIDTEAVGDFESSRRSHRWNGYYSWARMGYNAQLDEGDWTKFPLTFRGIPDLNELFMQTNGKFVWLYHGSSKDMIFDLDDEARSMRILRAYLQERGFDIDFD